MLVNSSIYFKNLNNENLLLQCWLVKHGKYALRIVSLGCRAMFILNSASV